MNIPAKAPFRVALISMPWAIFNRPSIQLGALKAFLEEEDDIEVETFHPFLEIAKQIGIDTYRTLSNDSWAGETLYAPLLFPEVTKNSKKLFNARKLRGTSSGLTYDHIAENLKESLHLFINNLPLDNFNLVGFSICFSQLFSSLVAAQKIKAIRKDLPIVFGGSSCAGEIGTSLLTQFPQIDYCIDGEGETALLALCHFLSSRRDLSSQSGDTTKQFKSKSCSNITDINCLPIPDYAPYFKELQQSFPGLPFQPVLPLELSRGCWWNKCTFCNLNMQWEGYRWKNAERTLKEVRHLSQKHQCLDFTFTDNALPPKESDLFFKGLSQEENDLRFFAEIRVITSPEQLSLYRSGGLDHVQVGIESLSTSLLQKLQKGTTVIENIAAMKHCAEQHIKLEGNLIIEFPGSTESEIAETLKHLDYVLPFHPLSTASFFLGLGSPIENGHQDYGLYAIRNHENYKQLMPKSFYEKLELLVKSYRGNRQQQRQLWKPVDKKIKTWQEFHENRKGHTIPPLSYRDGGTFLIIRQEREQEEALIHRIKGLSREIYLFCATIRTMENIKLQFPSLPEKTLLNFFDDLSKKRLLFKENDKILSLAVHTLQHSTS